MQNNPLRIPSANAPTLARIFSVLALVAMILLAANFVVGLSIGDFNRVAHDYSAATTEFLELKRSPASTPAELAAAREHVDAAAAKFETPHSRVVAHRLLGVAAALMAILVNSITITYFIGTSRWCKEVSDTYSLPVELSQRSTALKRRTFPWALLGIVTIIVLVGFGAAADPSGSNRANSASLVQPHYWLALIGIVVVGGAFWVQIMRIAENYAVIDEILAHVQRIRAERELQASEQAAP
jgi:hypothetical protein